ncbi:MAG: class I SAM-dependent methyltransferase [Bacteriovoracaceae bacterium]|nr:class I SAM-dependent methyltransferase [Bacteriovoracaceae bacterium]
MSDDKIFAEKYFKVLNTELAGLNLTAIDDFEDFYAKQILDSINPLKIQSFYNNLTSAKAVVDIGFGGGFPILPLAYKLPSQKFIGIESKRKKVDAVALIADKLGIKNTKLLHYRLEEVNFDQNLVILSKAVMTVEKMLTNLNFTSDLLVYFYKGPNFLELEADGLKKIEKNWELVENFPVEVPLTEKRIVVGFRNRFVPRGTTKKLVNLSAIL